MGTPRKTGKWIDGLGPETAVDAAARRVLRVRLDAIAVHIPLASARADEDVEHVHQLRVTTRRAEAALRIFEGAVRPRRYRKVRKALKRIRRAAGAARASDVHLIELEAMGEQAEPDLAGTLAAVVAWTKAARRRAQEEIVHVGDHYGSRIAKLRDRLLDGIRDDDRPLLTLCRESIGAALETVEVAIGADLDVLDNLHELRIHSKRLRYSLEVFASCLGPDFKASYAALVRLQDALGLINDLDEIATWLEDYLRDTEGSAADAAHRGAVPELIATLERRRDEHVATFHAAFDADVRRDIIGRVRSLIEPSATCSITGANRLRAS